MNETREAAGQAGAEDFEDFSPCGGIAHHTRRRCAVVSDMLDTPYNVSVQMHRVRAPGLSKPHLSHSVRLGWYCHFGPHGGYGRSPSDAYAMCMRQGGYR